MGGGMKDLGTDRWMDGWISPGGQRYIEIKQAFFLNILVIFGPFFLFF